MTIAFKCPLCNAPYSVKDEYSGRQANCKKCGGAMQVPKVAAHLGLAVGHGGIYVPNRDAPVVRRLRAAGAIIVGKANLHELAFGVRSNNPVASAFNLGTQVSSLMGGRRGFARMMGIVFVAALLFACVIFPGLMWWIAFVG